ncbi:MAG TPA: methyltransferase domain-containing protein [Rhodothermales bacterium]|nr:methyltransferase domain-containing protein [Rhodothermales bacterium]
MGIAQRIQAAVLGKLLHWPRFNRLLARHLRSPAGLFGRWTARLMNQSNAAMNERAVALLDIRTGQHVLDAGFGGAPALREMISLVGREGKVVGLDASATMVERAERQFEQFVKVGRLVLVEGAVEQMRFPEAHFDGAITVNTIYFWSDPAKGLARLYHVLKPGGRLVVGIRSAEEMRKMPFTAEGFTLYTPEQVEALLREAGFVQVYAEQVGGRPLGHVSVAGVKPFHVNERPEFRGEA